MFKRVACPSGINHISSVTSRGKMRFLIYEGTFTAGTFIKFLKQNVRAARGRKFIMIGDNLRGHHSTAVSEWLEGKQSQIEPEYLPACSPELNPDEYLHNDVKASVHRRAMPRTREELRASAGHHLRHIAKTPHRVRSCCNARHIRCAA